MATKQKSDDTKCGKESRAPGTLVQTCWNVNCFHQFGNNWNYLLTQLTCLSHMQKFPGVFPAQWCTPVCQYHVDNSTI